MTAATLTRTLAVQHLSDLLAVDQAAVKELGRSYSDEAWDAESFLKDLPGKWTFSVAIVDHGKIRGFWIASQKSPQLVYAHRIAVDPASRQHGWGRIMFETVYSKVKAQQISRMALSVSATNAPARRFFERIGFRRVVGDRIADALGGNAPSATFEFDHYRLPSGQRNLVYELLVEEGQIEDSRSRGPS